MNPFWNASQHSSTRALTLEDLEAATRALEAQLNEPLPRCPHIVSSTYLRDLRDRNVATTHCPWCGARVRV